MAISPIQMSGIIGRTQDVTTIKQNQDQKPIVQQHNLNQQIAKDINHNMKQVHDASNSDRKNEKFDAREEGKNKYSNLYDDKKKKEKKNNEAKSAGKTNSGQVRFDVKI